MASREEIIIHCVSTNNPNPNDPIDSFNFTVASTARGVDLSALHGDSTTTGGPMPVVPLGMIPQQVPVPPGKVTGVRVEGPQGQKRYVHNHVPWMRHTHRVHMAG